MAQLVGGPARARVIVLVGAVLALGSADAATVGDGPATRAGVPNRQREDRLPSGGAADLHRDRHADKAAGYPRAADTRLAVSIA